MARITTAPPVATTTAPTTAVETPDAPKGKPAQPRGPKGKPATPAGIPGYPAEKPTVRPPARPAKPAGKLGKPGKDAKPTTPANDPRIAAGPDGGPSGGRQGAKAASPARGRSIGPAPRSVTGRAYHGLDSAYAYFNRVLFGGRLPECVLTLQRKKGSLGYYAPARFVDSVAERTMDGVAMVAAALASGTRPPGSVDEIALNPTTFRDRSTLDVLSTLVHEMVHVAQSHFGKPSRGGYHNAEWAAAMTAIGLIPTDTGKPGGKQTGQHMDHMIDPGGRFDVAAAAFFAKGGRVTLFGDLWTEDDGATKPKSKAGAKAKYTCPVCGLNAWAKPDVRLTCSDCEEEMEAEPTG
jgi:hypothetical protein